MKSLHNIVFMIVSGMMPVMIIVIVGVVNIVVLYSSTHKNTNIKHIIYKGSTPATCILLNHTFSTRTGTPTTTTTTTNAAKTNTNNPAYWRH